MRKKKWTESQLIKAVETSFSFRQVLIKLGLKPAGGNYSQLKKYIKIHNQDISHFRGKGWNKGMRGRHSYRKPLDEILVKDSSYQSYKLKRRLFQAGLKSKECELCGWSKMTIDGRLPLELDHMNGDRRDNRLDNLRILCPNCHSLQTTHRGKNIRLI